MATKRLKHPRDPLRLAKLIGDKATGQIEDRVEDNQPIFGRLAQQRFSNCTTTAGCRS